MIFDTAMVCDRNSPVVFYNAQFVVPIGPKGSQSVIDSTEKYQEDASAGILASSRWRPIGGEESGLVGIEEGHHHGGHRHYRGIRR